MHTATAVGRDNHYRDPVELAERGIVDFEDPLERAAIAAHRLSFATPAEVVSLLTGEEGREALRYTWLRLLPTDRQFHRHRADVITQAHAGSLR